MRANRRLSLGPAPSHGVLLWQTLILLCPGTIRFRAQFDLSGPLHPHREEPAARRCDITPRPAPLPAHATGICQLPGDLVSTPRRPCLNSQEALRINLPGAAGRGVRFRIMWTTVLLLASSVIFEPIRISLVVLMLNRRRPALQLLAFWCGGATMGVGVGLVVLLILGATPLPGQITVPKVQIVTGLIALLIAAVLVTNVSRKRIRRTPAAAAVGGDAGAILLEPDPPSRLQQLSVRALRFLQGDSLYVAGVSGLGAALPSANYMGAIAAILASRAAPVVQAQ